jgi:hypothetical protein
MGTIMGRVKRKIIELVFAASARSNTFIPKNLPFLLQCCLRYRLQH